LQAVVNPNANFLDIYVGQLGNMNDGRVLRLSLLFEAASFGTLLQGEDVVLLLRRLGGAHEEVDEHYIPSILLGDSIYLSLPWLLASYKRLSTQPILCLAKKTFNKKLSKARI